MRAGGWHWELQVRMTEGGGPRGTWSWRTARPPQPPRCGCVNQERALLWAAAVPACPSARQVLSCSAQAAQPRLAALLSAFKKVQ